MSSLPQSTRTARPARLAEIPLIIRTAQEEAQAVTILRELFPATIPQVAGDSGRAEQRPSERERPALHHNIQRSNHP